MICDDQVNAESDVEYKIFNHENEECASLTFLSTFDI